MGLNIIQIIKSLIGKSILIFLTMIDGAKAAICQNLHPRMK